MIEGKTKLPGPSLVQKTREKRSELLITELEAVALDMFEQRGFATGGPQSPGGGSGHGSRYLMPR